MVDGSGNCQPVSGTSLDVESADDDAAVDNGQFETAQLCLPGYVSRTLQHLCVTLVVTMFVVSFLCAAETAFIQLKKQRASCACAGRRRRRGSACRNRHCCPAVDRWLATYNNDQWRKDNQIPDSAATSVLGSVVDGASYVAWPVPVKLKLHMSYICDVASGPSEPIAEPSADTLKDLLATSIVAAAISAAGSDERHSLRKKIIANKTYAKFIDKVNGHLLEQTRKTEPTTEQQRCDDEEDKAADLHVKAVAELIPTAADKDEFVAVHVICTEGANDTDCILQASDMYDFKNANTVQKHIKYWEETHSQESGIVEMVNTSTLKFGRTFNIARSARGHVEGLKWILAEGSKREHNADGAMTGIEPRKCLRYLIALDRAVTAIHQCGVVHNASNILSWQVVRSGLDGITLKLLGLQHAYVIGMEDSGSPSQNPDGEGALLSRGRSSQKLDMLRKLQQALEDIERSDTDGHVGSPTAALSTDIESLLAKYFGGITDTDKKMAFDVLARYVYTTDSDAVIHDLNTIIDTVTHRENFDDDPDLNGFRSLDELNHRKRAIDLWHLGLVGYELLSGKPFLDRKELRSSRHGGTAQQRIQQHLIELFRSDLKLREGVKMVVAWSPVTVQAAILVKIGPRTSSMGHLGTNSMTKWRSAIIESVTKSVNSELDLEPEPERSTGEHAEHPPTMRLRKEQVVVGPAETGEMVNKSEDKVFKATVNDGDVTRITIFISASTSDIANEHYIINRLRRMAVEDVEFTVDLGEADLQDHSSGAAITKVQAQIELKQPANRRGGRHERSSTHILAKRGNAYLSTSAVATSQQNFQLQRLEIVDDYSIDERRDERWFVVEDAGTNVRLGEGRFSPRTVDMLLKQEGKWSHNGTTDLVCSAEAHSYKRPSADSSSADQDNTGRQVTMLGKTVWLRHYEPNREAGYDDFALLVRLCPARQVQTAYGKKECRKDADLWSSLLFFDLEASISVTKPVVKAKISQMSSKQRVDRAEKLLYFARNLLEAKCLVSAKQFVEKAKHCDPKEQESLTERIAMTNMAVELQLTERSKLERTYQRLFNILHSCLQEDPVRAAAQ